MAQLLRSNKGTWVMCVLVLLTESTYALVGDWQAINERLREHARGHRRQDLRYGIRMMRRGPMLAVTAVATVALSTAAIATVATLADTLLWRQLPVDDERPSSPYGNARPSSD